MARYFSFGLSNTPFIDPDPQFAWSIEFHDKLLDRVSKIAPPERPGVELPNILLIGPNSSGKSSFINSVATVSEGIKVNLVNTARSDEHVTTVYRKLDARGGKLQNYVFADVRGISSGDTGIHIGNIMKLVKGHIKEGYEFTKDVSIEEDNEYYNKTPKESDKFQCVVFVFNCKFDPSPTETIMKDISTVNILLNQKGIPRIALLTRIDEHCPKVGSDIRNTFYSKRIKERMSKYSDITGIPESLFYPIKNYEAARYPDPMTSIPLLLAIEACLNSATTYLRHKLPGCSKTDANNRETDT